MSLIFGFIGHCKQGTSNKIWGWVLRGEPHAGYSYDPPQDCVIFWAGVGKAIQVKSSSTGWELRQLRKSKVEDKNYNPRQAEDILKIWPSFHNDLEMKIMTEVLAGKIK